MTTTDPSGKNPASMALARWNRALRQERDDLKAKLSQVEKERSEDKSYIEDLCKDLCKMEDVLGFANDQTDKDGAFIPTIGPWLERVRDLIAAEGELGDVKERLAQVEADAGFSCILAGPGRGDCEHFVGLPGKSVPGQHDGPDDTLDVYGKPNGWCWSCWRSHQIVELRSKLSKAEQLVASYDRQDELIGTEFEGVDGVTDVIRLLKLQRQEKNSQLESAITELAKAKADLDSAYAALNSDEVASRASNRLIDELATLRATAQRRLELLRKCEWEASSGVVGSLCPICRQFRLDDHKFDCPLAAELKEGK